MRMGHEQVDAEERAQSSKHGGCAEQRIPDPPFRIATLDGWAALDGISAASLLTRCATLNSMRSAWKALLALVVLLSPILHAATPQAGVEAFNQAFGAATRRMDNAAILALWTDDGVSLLPSTPPIVGKKAIGAFLDAVMAQLSGAHMETFEMQCRDITISGALAAEWCTEHQIVRLAGDKPPFEGWGKMLLVLRRDDDGRWRLKTEMWNQALAPGAK
jgi:ketosteroid isomerase-like protein